MNMGNVHTTDEFRRLSRLLEIGEVERVQRAAVELLRSSKLNVGAWRLLGMTLEVAKLLGAAYQAYRRASLLDPNWQWERSAAMRAQVKWQEATPEWLADLLAVAQVSVCAVILARNESAFIVDTLRRIGPAVDEVVVVDTGSEDDTIEKAESMGAKVYTYNWDYDFSAARNFALSKVTSDWVLFVDADEWLDEEDAQAVREVAGMFHEINPKTMLRVVQVNHVGDEMLSSEMPVRLFPTAYGLCWQGRVCEQVVLPRTEDSAQWQEALVRVRLHHYGYDLNRQGAEQRLHRNVNLLEEVVSEHPEDIGAWGSLGQQLFMLEQDDQAIECYQQVEELASQYPEYGHLTEARVMLARALVRQERFLEAIGVLERSLNGDPEYPGSHFYLGDAKLKLAVKLLTEARESFGKSRSFAKDYRGLSGFDENIARWKATAGIADTHKYQGHMIQAYEGYRKVLRENPNDVTAQKEMFFLELQAKEIINDGKSAKGRS